MQLQADAGGNGDRVLVLLHGMGTTREVWAPFVGVLDREWRGRWIAPDLRGHGRSPHARSYALSDHAADVAELVGRVAPDRSEAVVLGHSMGGVVALALASGDYGVRPRAALGLGIKIAWSAEEIAGLAARAEASARTFASAAETAAFYLKVAGLRGLVSDNTAMARAGVAADSLRLACDPAIGRIGPPSMAELIAGAHAPIYLAAGETDAMSTLADMRAHDPAAMLIPGAGHNAMVEAPGRVWAWVKECIGSDD